MEKKEKGGKQNEDGLTLRAARSMLSKLRVVFSLDIVVNNSVRGLVFVDETWTGLTFSSAN